MTAAIAKKLAEVGRAVGFGVPKDGRNQQQRYDYVSAAQVKILVGPELARRNVAVSSQVEILMTDSITTKAGGEMQRITARVTLTFVDGDSGESLQSQGIGGGSDSGDKAAMKAFTAAEKYAYVGAFCLAFGEDPEADEEVDRQTSGPAPRPRDEQRREPRRDDSSRPSAASAEPSEALKDALADLAVCEDEDSISHWWDKWLDRLRGFEPQDKQRVWAAMSERARLLRIDTNTLNRLREDAAKRRAQAA